MILISCKSVSTYQLIQAMLTLPVPSLQSTTAEADAYQHIHTAIRLGEYPAGMRLKPENIAAQIGTSRMPVREALRRLETEGLVTIRPNRGVVVAGLDFEAMREVFEMRAVLEGLAVRLAVPHLTPAILRDLEMQLARMDNLAESTPDWTGSHRAFHEYLCGISGQPRLLRQIASLNSLVEPYMRAWIKASGRPGAREHHQTLIDALRGGDPEDSEIVMRQHVLATVDDLAPLSSVPTQGASA